MSAGPRAAELRFEDIAVGQSFELEHAFAAADVRRFAELSGDFSPLHVDEAYARGTEFGGCVVHGILLASLFSQIVGMHLPGKAALYLGQELSFRRPVRVGERVRAIARVTGVSAPTRSLVLATEIRNADGQVAVSGAGKVKVRGEAAVTATARPVLAAAASAAPAARVAIVTGASRGIGAEIARALGQAGFAVAVNYHRNAARADEVCGAITQAGGRAVALQADVRDAGAVDALVAGTVAAFGPPTALVNSAAAEFGVRPFVELSWDDFQAQLDQQARAAVNTCQAVYPHMRAAGGGAIVNVLSQVTLGAPAPRMADYTTAKYALAGLSRALAAEWAEDGIRVNMVSPGLVRTELTEFHHERVFKGEAMRTPLKRLATPQDVAQAVAYLLGDGAAFLTGINLPVTGGQVMS